MRTNLLTVPAIIAASLVGFAGTANAQSDSDRPLFESDAPLALTIEAPFRQLSRNTDEREELAGVVRYRAPDGSELMLDAEIRVRGKTRLEICDFPPLRIDFKRGQLDGTVFAGQNHLKLATLCKERDAYRDYLAQEFQVYKAYNALTDRSFRVRWVNVEYVDTGDDRAEPFTEGAFFIEEDWEVAERHGLEALTVPNVALASLDLRSMALLSLFQYMIANVDWSGISPAPGEDCCHNAKPIGGPGGTDVALLPYDFDQSGLVSAGYATPRADLGARSIRERIYRGYCVANGEIDWAVQRFNEVRPQIESVFDSEPVEARTRERTLEYVADFYEIINDPKERRDEIDDECRG
jgi:hypothetical protein